MNSKMIFAKVDCKDPIKVAKWLREYNLWRLGRGKYGWSENPKSNQELPLSSKELSMVIDAAIGFLRKK